MITIIDVILVLVLNYFRESLWTRKFVLFGNNSTTWEIANDDNIYIDKWIYTLPLIRGEGHCLVGYIFGDLLSIIQE